MAEHLQQTEQPLYNKLVGSSITQTQTQSQESRVRVSQTQSKPIQVQLAWRLVVVGNRRRVRSVCFVSHSQSTIEKGACVASSCAAV